MVLQIISTKLKVTDQSQNIQQINKKLLLATPKKFEVLPAREARLAFLVQFASMLKNMVLKAKDQAFNI